MVRCYWHVLPGDELLRERHDEEKEDRGDLVAEPDLRARAVNEPICVKMERQNDKDTEPARWCG